MIRTRRLMTSALGSLIALSLSAAAEDSMRRGELLLLVEVLIFIFFIATVIQLARIIRIFGKSVFAVPFIYMLAGTLMLWLTRFMYILFEFKILNIADDTLEFWWHMIFYIAILSFLIGLNKIKDRVYKQGFEGFTGKDATIITICGTVVLVLFATAKPLDSWFVSWFDNSIADKFGLQHFIAFAFVGLLATTLWWAKRKEEYVGKIVVKILPSLLVFLILLSLNHFWELLTESWKLIVLEEPIIESTEQLFWLPSFFVLYYGISNLIKEIKKSLEAR